MTIEQQQERDHKIGEAIAKTLNLKPLKGYAPTRYETDWGSKTAIGLARTIRSIFEEKK